MTSVAAPAKTLRYWRRSSPAPISEGHSDQEPHKDGAEIKELSTHPSVWSACRCHECPVHNANLRQVDGAWHGTGVSHTLRTWRECLKIALPLVSANLPRYRIDLQTHTRGLLHHGGDIPKATTVQGFSVMQDESVLARFARSISLGATVQKISIVLVTPAPLVVLGSYGMNHAHPNADIGEWTRQGSYKPAHFAAVSNTLAILENPNGMLFFASGIAAAFLLTLLWLQRRHRDKHSIVIPAIILAPPLIAVATGLKVLVALLCILPWTMYATIVLNDAAHMWLDCRRSRARRNTVVILEEPKRAEIGIPRVEPVLVETESRAVRSEVSDMTAV